MCVQQCRCLCAVAAVVAVIEEERCAQGAELNPIWLICKYFLFFAASASLCWSATHGSRWNGTGGGGSEGCGESWQVQLNERWGWEKLWGLEKWLKKWSVRKQGIKKKSEAAELFSPELQRWVLRPCWTTARTTQQQTQKIDSLFFRLLFPGSGLLCPLLLIYQLRSHNLRKRDGRKRVVDRWNQRNNSLLINGNKDYKIKTGRIQSRPKEHIRACSFWTTRIQHGATKALTEY